MIVYFVRHAERLKAGERSPESPLTENGFRQGELVGERIKKVQIDVIYSSSYTRAKQTAEVISKIINKPIELWDHLIEADSEKETFNELNSRSKAILEHLLSHHRNESVLCVSHASMIETIIAKMVFGDNLSAEILNDLRKHFGTTNTGVSICEFTEKDGWTLKTFNDSSHL